MLLSMLVEKVHLLPAQQCVISQLCRSEVSATMMMWRRYDGSITLILHSVGIKQMLRIMLGIMNAALLNLLIFMASRVGRMKHTMHSVCPTATIVLYSAAHRGGNRK